MEITPTRSALLEAKDERHVMGEGFRFLDEKRLLLAAEIVRQFKQYEGLQKTFTETHQQATAAMAEAVQRHGFQGVQLYPARINQNARVQKNDKIFFGVNLAEAVQLLPNPPPPPRPPVNPSPEAALAQQIFQALLKQSAPLAAITGNLHRLLDEYKRTERRARALEDVILPELDEAIHEIDIRLEEMEQEEAVRVRLKKEDRIDGH